jgi:hypothetical protein
LRESHAILRQRIKIRRLDVAAVTTQIGIPQIVGQKTTLGTFRAGLSAANSSAAVVRNDRTRRTTSLMFMVNPTHK